jgi:hypothetical protein
MPQLKNWKILDDPVEANDNPYMAPEQIRKCFWGHVYGHSKFPDGSAVLTGHIQKVDWFKRTFSTHRTQYELVGPPDPEFRDWVEKNYPQLLKNIED